MPTPEPDFIVTATTPAVSVALEPAQNAIHSLSLLVKSQCSGLDEWVPRIAGTLSPAERERNELVLIGLHYAVLPEQPGWLSFPAYVDHLAAGDPYALRDKLLAAYTRFLLWNRKKHPERYADADPVDLDAALADVDSYLGFLRACFNVEHVDDELESRAYAYVMDPPAMQELIVSHLRAMWTGYLAPEWQRVEPLLRDAVQAFQQMDLGNMGRLEAAQFVTGRELEREKWEWILNLAGQVIFVPTAHVGPHVGRLGVGGGTLWVFFGAWTPEGHQVLVPDLNRAEIVERLSALADEVRLHILKLVAEEGELYSQDIMERLDLSQSAASRHLKQLSAVGYLTARRHEGAKCFALNPGHIEDTLRAVSLYLLKK